MIKASFNNQDFDYEIYLNEPNSISSGVTLSVDGTPHFSVGTGNNSDSWYISGSGIMNSDIYETLRGYLGTSYSLECTFGTCSAVLVGINRAERAGYVDANTDLYDVSLSFLRVSVWS